VSPKAEASRSEADACAWVWMWSPPRRPHWTRSGAGGGRWVTENVQEGDVAARYAVSPDQELWTLHRPASSGVIASL
jgi:hypothetical protein